MVGSSIYAFRLHLFQYATFSRVWQYFRGKCFSGKGKLDLNGLKITCTCAKLLTLQVLMDKKKALGPLCNCLLILLFAYTFIPFLLYSLRCLSHFFILDLSLCFADLSIFLSLFSES